MRNKFTISVLLFTSILISNSGNAQYVIKDSLIANFDIIYNRYSKEKNIDILKALNELSAKIGDAEHLCVYHFCAADYYSNAINFDSCLHHGEQTLKWAKQILKESKIPKVLVSYQRLSNYYLRFGEEEKCMRLILEFDSLYSSFADADFKGGMYRSLAVIYRNSDKLEQSSSTFQKAIKHLNSDSRYFTKCLTYQEWGRTLALMGKYELAQNALDSARVYLRKSQRDTSLDCAACFAITMGEINLKLLKNDYLAAEKKLVEMKNDETRKLANHELMGVCFELQKIYTKTKQKDKAYEMIYLQDSLEELYQINSFYGEDLGLKQKIETFVAFQDYENAYNSSSLLQKIKDSINSVNNQMVVADLQVKYETLEKERLLKEQEINSEKLRQLTQLKFEYEKKQAAAKTSQEKKLLLLEEDLKRKQIEEQFANKSMIAKMEFTRKQELLEAENKREVAKQELELKEQKYKTYSLAGLGSLALIGIGLAYRRARLNKKNSLILQAKNEKIETLIKELHHRVKNNLQVVSSLLSIQSGTVEDKKAKKVLLEGQHRVDAMGLIHQKLYMNDNTTHVDMKDYIETLSKQLLFSFSSESENEVTVQSDIDAIALPIDTAIPVGLIANELITNALKYGLNSQKPKLNISFKEVDESSWQLVVKDNGSGFKSDDGNHASMGLKLVAALTKQINGTLTKQTFEGATIIIDIPNTK